MTIAFLTRARAFAPLVMHALFVTAAIACDADGDEPAESEATGAAVVNSLPPNGEGADAAPLRYFGGPVQLRPEVYLVFWGPKWQTDAAHLQAKGQVVDTFQALPGSNYNNLLSQYFVADGRFLRNDVYLRAALIDSTTPPAGLGLGIELDDVPVPPAQIRDAALRALADRGLQVKHSRTQVLVFPQQGSTYTLTSGGDICGQHSWVSSIGLAYGFAKWAADTNCQMSGTSGQSKASSNPTDIAWTAVHEYAEMATDPDITLKPNPNGLGWHTLETILDALTPHEVTDMCERWTVKATASKPPDQRPNYHTAFPLPRDYLLPMQYSNETAACEMQRGKEFFSPDVVPPFNHKHTVSGPILEKYESMGADIGLLGPPADEEHRDATGAFQYFAGQVCNGGFTDEGRLSGSAIYKERGQPAHEVHGCIYQKYAATGATSGLGYPVTDELTVAEGRVSHFRGTPCPGGAPSNAGGAGIYYSFSQPTGAHIVKGCSYGEYARAGGPAFLGFPLTDEEAAGGGATVNYFTGQVCNGGGPTLNGIQSGSAIYYSAATGAHEVHGCIFQKYFANGGARTMGPPVIEEIDIPNTAFGRASYFAGAKCPTASGPFNSGSAIFFSPWLGAHAVQGCIYPHYVHAQGGPAGHLGFPTSDQLMIAGGRVSYFDGHGCARRGPENSGSAIYSSIAGTHAVWGCIYEKYIYDTHRTGGGPNGHLSFPTTDEIGIPGGAVSYFYGNNCGPDRGPFNEGSAIYAGPGGVHSVEGCIYRRYRLPEKPFNGAPDEPGGPASHLGWPTSDEIEIPGKGWVSYFQGNGCTSGERGPNDSGSAIYADALGVHAVQGCIYTKYWRDHGGPDGILGFPTTTELQVNGGWASYFRAPTNFCGPESGPGGSGAGIFASGATGVHTVQGCIFTGYMRFGGPGNHLGFPVSEEIQIPNGWVSYFAGNPCPGYVGPAGSGSAIYAGPGGTHFVQGCIYKKYIELGGPGGRLGFPTSDETPNSTGWISHFQHGYIRATGSSIIVFIG
jgi:uncharacterized protein with LGFP repeats